LPPHGLLPRDAEPAKILVNCRFIFRPAALRVDILDTQKQRAPRRTRCVGIEQRRIGVTQMQIPVRTWSEAQDSGVHRRCVVAIQLFTREIDQTCFANQSSRTEQPQIGTSLHSRTMTHIHTEADLDLALAALGRADPRFLALVAAAGRPPLRRRADGFPGLATIIVSQQLSTASAGAIFGRLAAAFEPLTPEAILRARPARLARIGLSSPKIRTLKEIARAITRNKLMLATLGELAAEDAHTALTAVHGIGPWTADIYLLACLGHADAWPAGDLALQEAARLAFGLEARPTAKEMIPLAEPWRPWRSVAARVLWTYYRDVKGREGAPVVAQSKPKIKAKRGVNGRRA